MPCNRGSYGDHEPSRTCGPWSGHTAWCRTAARRGRGRSASLPRGGSWGRAAALCWCRSGQSAPADRTSAPRRQPAAHSERYEASMPSFSRRGSPLSANRAPCCHMQLLLVTRRAPDLDCHWICCAAAGRQLAWYGGHLEDAGAGCVRDPQARHAERGHIEQTLVVRDGAHRHRNVVLLRTRWSWIMHCCGKREGCCRMQ